MRFLPVNVTFYDAVNMIHRTGNSFPYTSKFMFVGVRNNRTQQIRRWKINRIHVRTRCCCISKISNSVGRNDNFPAKARKLSILPTELDILLYGSTMSVFSISNQLEADLESVSTTHA